MKEKGNQTQNYFDHILVIQTAFIGDVILTTPLLRATKRGFRQASVDVLVTPRTAELLASNPCVDRIIPYDKRGEERGVVNLLKLARALRRQNYDLALIPHRSWRSAFLTLLAKIPIRIGFDTSPGSLFYTQKVRYRKGVHEAVRNLDLLSPFELNNSADPTPEMFTSQADEQRALEMLRKHNVEDGRAIIGVGAGSVWPTKRWLPEGFAEVSDRLMAERKAEVIFFGGPEDAALCEHISSMMGRLPIIGAGSLSLKESAALIARCHVFLSNDTGLMHLAAAMKVPVVAIFGATVSAFGFTPFGEGHTVIEKTLKCRPCSIHGKDRCREKTFACMREIEPEEVYEAIVRYL